MLQHGKLYGSGVALRDPCPVSFLSSFKVFLLSTPSSVLSSLFLFFFHDKPPLFFPQSLCHPIRTFHPFMSLILKMLQHFCPSASYPPPFLPPSFLECFSTSPSFQHCAVLQHLAGSVLQEIAGSVLQHLAGSAVPYLANRRKNNVL